MPKIRTILKVIDELNAAQKPVLVKRKTMAAFPRKDGLAGYMHAFRAVLGAKGISHKIEDPKHHLECCVSTQWTKKGLIVQNFYREWRKSAK